MGSRKNLRELSIQLTTYKRQTRFRRRFRVIVFRARRGPNPSVLVSKVYETIAAGFPSRVFRLNATKITGRAARSVPFGKSAEIVRLHRRREQIKTVAATDSRQSVRTAVRAANRKIVIVFAPSRTVERTRNRPNKYSCAPNVRVCVCVLGGREKAAQVNRNILIRYIESAVRSQYDSNAR